MRKKRLIQTAAAVMACMLTLQAVNLPQMTAYGENGAENTADNTADSKETEDFIKNISA